VPIAHVGTLPVSALNVGLGASIGGLTAEVTKLHADISGLFPALAAQLEVSVNFPPNPVSYLAAISASLNPIEVAAQLNPANFVVAGAAAGIDLALELGLIEAQLAVATTIEASLSAGLSAGGIAGWSYSGRSATFGTALESATSGGFGKTAADVPIVGIVIATEDFGSWGSFSQGFRTGSTANAPADPNAGRLSFLGELGGGEWNTGAAQVKRRLDLFIAELRGIRVGILASLQVTLGLDLPDPSLLVSAGVGIVADLGIDGLLDNMINVDADITGTIGGIQAGIDANLSLAAYLNAQLSAGGLSLWTYSGPAGTFGSGLRGELANGIPGGSGANAAAYGVALAGSASAMGLFGSIFKVS
jgi:hypothetical protein